MWCRPIATIALVLCAVSGCASSGGGNDGSPDGFADGLSFVDRGTQRDQEVDLPPDQGPDQTLDQTLDLPPDLPPVDTLDACVPRCAGLACGADGCRGSCGSCAADEVCAAGTCEAKLLEVAIVSAPSLVWQYEALNSCVYPDGPLRLYRDGSGRASAIMPQIKNYRLVSSTTDGELTIKPTDPAPSVYDSPLNEIESIYDSRFMLAGLWTEDGQTIHAVAHHEWYNPGLVTVQGKCGPFVPNGSFGWVNAVHHMTSSDGGASFVATTPFVPPISYQADRLVLAPERWTVQGVAKPVYPQGETRYGFFRPSNIVEEGGFYYIAVAVEELVRALPGAVDLIPPRRGFLLARTTDIGGGWANGKWQHYNGSSWTPVSGVIANGASHIFTHAASHPGPRTVVPIGDPKLDGDLFSMTHNLVRCTLTDRWLLLGHTGSSRYLAFSSTKSLSLPAWTPVQAVVGSHELKLGSTIHPWPVDEGGKQVSEWAGAYPSLVDHQSAGKVYMFTGASPSLYYIKTNNGIDRDLYRVELQITVK